MRMPEAIRWSKLPPSNSHENARPHRLSDRIAFGHTCCRFNAHRQHHCKADRLAFTGAFIISHRSVYPISFHNIFLHVDKHIVGLPDGIRHRFSHTQLLAVQHRIDVSLTQPIVLFVLFHYAHDKRIGFTVTVEDSLSFSVGNRYGVHLFISVDF